MPPLRVAVVGVGHLGKEHARVYSEIPDSKLVTVIDIDESRAKAIAEKWGAAWQTGLYNLRGRIEAASVVVPTQYHFYVTSILLQQGIAVLVEKPMTDNVDQAEALVDMAERIGVPLQVGHIERFNPAFAGMQKYQLKPTFIECDRLAPFSFRSADVGVVFDLMIHDIDIVHHVVESPLKGVEAVGVDMLTNHEDIANARLTFRNGCVADLTASRAAVKGERRMRMFSSDCFATVDYGQRKAQIYRKSPELTIASIRARHKDVKRLLELKKFQFGDLLSVEEVKVDEYEPLRKEIEAFVTAVQKKTKPLVPGEDGLRAVRTATEVLKEIRKNLKRLGRTPDKDMGTSRATRLQ